MKELNLQRKTLIRVCRSKIFRTIKILMLISVIINLNLIRVFADDLQQKKVTGTVTDSQTGGALTGVTVKLRGTNIGTITDINGNYAVDVLNENSVLEFSFIGYGNQNIPVGNQSNINITLSEELTSLEEVVVIGYGVQKKINLTGSVSSMSSDKLATLPTPNVSSLLYGNLPGLIAIQRSGQPGADGVDLSIRGFGTALIVVDGVVGRSFDRLDPLEIESITILKDAAASAVYGVSGGNGVILVKTKRGNIGKPVLSYNFNYGVQHVTRYPRFVNSAEFAELKNEAAMNIGATLPYSAEQIEKYRLGTDPNYLNFDYYHYFVRDYPPQMSQNISIKGGSEKIRYYFLLGQSVQAAMWNTISGGQQEFAKYNFRSNIDATINDNLDISINIGGREESRDNLVQDSYLMASWMQYQFPIFNPLTPDGKISANTNGRYAYLDRDIAGYDLTKGYTFQGDLTVNYKIPFIKGLSAHATFAQDFYFSKHKLWQKKYGLYSWDEATKTSSLVLSKEVDQLVIDDALSYANRINASFTYSRNFFNSHNINALILYEESETADNTFSGSRINYVVSIDQIFAGPDLNKSNSGSASDNGRQSLVGRVNYDYLGKYLLEYSFRYDGSAKFPPATRWGYFSGISAGWRISEEKFIKDNFSSLDNLKLRVAWGKLGNDNTANFQFLTGYTYPSTSYILGGNIVTRGMVESGIPNPNITWESSHTLNIGLDFGLWKRLLEVEFDIFNRNREGLLARRTASLPSTFGATLPSENLNSDNTRGFEILVRHSHQIGGIRYNISSNLSYTKSRNLHVEQREFTSQVDSWRNNVEDRFKNRYFTLLAIGQFQSLEEINSSPIQDSKNNSTLRPGDIKYDDLNKDGFINSYDYQPIGRGNTPEINFGLGFNATWKNLSIDMNWQGSANFVVEKQTYLIQPFSNNMNTYAYFMDRWHRADQFDPNSAWVPGKFPSTINDGAPNNKMLSSFWIQDASYLRLKVLSISYRTQIKPLKRFGIEDVRIVLSGQNLVTITGLDYIDPETPNGRLSYYPEQKTYNIGLNITF